MTKHPSYLILIVALAAGCESRAEKQRHQAERDAAYNADVAARAKQRWEHFDRKYKDIQLCRDRGGVPTTRPAQGRYFNETWEELERCDFPPTQPHVGKVE
jgi:hypothetical protein